MNFEQQALANNSSKINQRICLLGILLLLVFFASQLLKHADEALHTYNDSGAEAYVLLASDQFLAKGFIPCRFMMIHNVGGDNCYDLRNWAYGRYPPLAEILLTLERRYLGAHTLFQYRLAPIAFTLTAVFFCYLLFSALSGQPTFGLFVAFIYSFNTTFMKNGDNLHQYPISEMLRMLSPYLVLKWARSETNSKRRNYFALSLITFFLGTCVSWEFVIGNLMLTMFILYTENRRKGFAGSPIRQLLNAALVMIPFGLMVGATFTLNILKNGWYYGSAYAAVKEMVLSMLYRVSGQVLTESGPITVTFFDLLHGIRTRSEFVMGTTPELLWMFLALVAYVMFRAFYDQDAFARKYFNLLVVFFFANISFLMFMQQWAYHHYGLAGARHVLPTLGLLVGGGTFFILRDLFLLIRGQLSRSAVHILLVLAMLPVSYQFFQNARWNVMQTIDLWETSPKNSWEYHFQIFDELRAELPPDAVIMGNTFWRPEQRWRMGRYSEIAEYYPGMRAALVNLRRISKNGPIYFLYFDRVHTGKEIYFPIYTAEQADLEKASAELLEWIRANALHVRSAAADPRWQLYRLNPDQQLRLPPLQFD